MVGPLIAIPVIAVLGFYGIKLSVRVIVILGGLEFLIVLALGLSGLISPGPGGFTVRAFDPGFNPGHLATAMVSRWPSPFPAGADRRQLRCRLPEETASRCNVLIATMVSIVITCGVMTVVVIWGQVIGWGWLDVAKLPGSRPNFPPWSSPTGSGARSGGSRCSPCSPRSWPRAWPPRTSRPACGTGWPRTGVLPRVVATCATPSARRPRSRSCFSSCCPWGLAFIGGGLLGPGHVLHLDGRLLPGAGGHLRLLDGQHRRGRSLLAPPAPRVQLGAALHLPGRHDRHPDLLAGEVVQPVPRLSRQLVAGDRRRVDARRRRRPGDPEGARRRDVAAESRRDHRQPYCDRRGC